jgi:NAD(P)-dependent dehydrogenase (short-subunit alcohol dehydrogenase family)
MVILYVPLLLSDFSDFKAHELSLRSLQVNHLGTAMLALLLLPYMTSAPGFPRISIVSSEVHFWLKDLNEAKSRQVLKDLNNKETTKMLQRYHVTKRMIHSCASCATTLIRL